MGVKPSEKVLIMKMTNNKNKKNNNNKQKKQKGPKRGMNQHMNVVVNTPFGDHAKPKTIAAGLDAFSSTHVPLPIATGGYTTVRSSQIISTTSKFGLVGPTRDKFDNWTTICALTAVNSAAAVNAANNTTAHVFDGMTSSGWGAAKIVPAACSAQIINPEAPNTTVGTVFLGRAKQIVDFAGQTVTWDSKANELISGSAPRMLSATRLANHGVQIDCVPGDMTALGDFRQIDVVAGGAFTYDGSSGRDFDGMMPLFFYNPNQVNLQILVCFEWRVRFDPANPAYNSHYLHQASTPGYWERVLEYAEATGNGALDIAQRVAASAGRAALSYAVARHTRGRHMAIEL
jgi:hypothetical protein